MAQRIAIPTGNWQMALVEAIDRAAPGDTIVVNTEAMKQLGLLAKARMHPDKQITFERKDPPEAPGSHLEAMPSQLL
jgi:hypothetical protein